MKILKTMILAGLIALPLAACEYLATADAITEKAVTKVCGQGEEFRRLERTKLAAWGLWAKCVPAGSVYENFELSAKAVP